ncbi:MAG TPA: multidrug effflux MFS transporter [Bauldia sp.]|nr:multidrug effflux MFS transporter [Bauldia sp.]
MNTNNFARNAIILGLLSAVGPFAIDMYLPALPAIAADLNASTGATQMSLMSFFAAVAVCQTIYGPASDIFGRKNPLYFGLALYVLGAIGCSLAPSVEWLIAFRFVQGVGACAGMTIPRAIVRDLHTGHAATRLMSTIMLVFSVSPILAPLIGSTLISFIGWRAIFAVVGVIGLLAIGLVALGLPETRTAEQRAGSSFGSVLRGYGMLLRDRHFLGVTMIGGLGMSSFFAFLATSSFVYIDHFGLTPFLYGFAFSVNAIAFIGMAQATSWLGRRFGIARLIRTAITFFAGIGVLLLALTLAGVDSLPVLMTLLFVGFGALGLVIPSSMVLALEEHGAIAGTAAALGGTLQLVAGAVVISLVSAFFDGTPLPMVIAIAACGLGAFTVAWLTLSRRDEAVAMPAE